MKESNSVLFLLAIALRKKIDNFWFRKPGKYFKKSVDGVLSKFSKSSSRGFALIMICVLVPVLLLGGRWVLEYANRDKIFKKMNVEKRCAQEVALAVANSINPGLRFTDQKETLLRVADEVYNKMPAYGDNKIPNAIPGLQSPIYEKKKDGKNYDPMVIGINEYQSFAPDVKQIKYKAANKYVYRVPYSGNSCVGEVFRRVYFLKKNSKVTDEYAIIDFLPYINSDGNNVNVYSYGSFHQGADQATHGPMSYLATSSNSNFKDPDYMERSDPNDSQVQIAIDNDRIWAKTDDDVAYAKPAECNVDIVITVPTNMAACNMDNTNEAPTILSNYDTSTTISSETLANNAGVKNFRATPIYQIGQAYHYFLQHFLHTRGTNVGIVPYSGKLSLPPDRADGWSQGFPAFSWPDGCQNSYIHNLKGSFLYGTVGAKGTALSIQYSTWGGYNIAEKHGGYGIMLRGNTLQEGSYANNQVCHGDLLDNSNPASYKFYRFNYNPCYITNINLLSGTSTSNSLQYCHNPYFVVELQADVAKIDDLMDVFVPFNDQNNNSNFIFLPITWAQNLFQNWSKDPQQSSRTSKEEFFRQSKTTANRKKAVILIVNKPDWFEPNEMTYLGFDNDFSEMPFVESDCINFGTDFSDRNKKFADGSAYDGTIQGQKKILTCALSNVIRNATTGYYECTGDGTATLNFPKRCLVKVVVEPCDSYGVAATIPGSNGIYILKYVGGEFIAVNNNRCTNVFTSTDALSWTQRSNIDSGCGTATTYSLAYGNGCYLHSTHDQGYIRKTISLDSGWQVCRSSLCSNLRSMVFVPDKGFFVVNKDGYLYCDDLSNGSSWTNLGQKLSALSSKAEIQSIAYGNGKLLAITATGWTSISSDNGNTWSTPIQSLSKLYRTGIYQLSYGDNKFMALDYEGWISSSSDGLTWTTPQQVILFGQCSRGIAYGNNRWCVVDVNRNVYLANYGNITFGGISSGVCTDASKKIIQKRATFYIEPSQISSSHKITMTLKNIRLISAEITNRPYEIVKSACSFEGTTNGTGTAYIKTNAKEHISFDANLISSVQIYNSNGVSENVGTYSIAANGSKSFKFTGSNNFVDLTDGSRTIYQMSTSGGINFGHNLSTQKLKYKLTHAQLTTATLKNQLLRWYAHYYLKSDDVNRKGIITANGHVAVVKNNTAEQYSDPCISTSYNGPYNTSEGFTFTTASPQLAQVDAYNFHPACYGIKKGKFIFTATNFPASSVIDGDRGMTIQSKGTVWDSLNKNVNEYGSNEYQVVSFNRSNTDFVSIFTGRVKYKSSTDYSYSYEETNYTSATNVTTFFIHHGESSGCGGHFVKTCDECETYECKVYTHCPSGYSPVIPNQTVATQHDINVTKNRGNFSYTIKAKRNEMAAITCTNGCYVARKNLTNGCYKIDTVSGNCTKTYNTRGSQTGNTCPPQDSNPSKIRDNYTNYRYDLNNFFFLNSEEKTLMGTVSSFNDANLLRNNGIYYSGTKAGDGDGWLYFCGDGELDVSFSSLKSYLTYYDASGNAKKMEITVNQTFNFSPETHQYIKQSDGTYKIRLDIDGIQLSNVRFNPKLTDYTCRMKKIATPQNCGYARWDGGSDSIASDNISRYDFKNMSYDNSRLAYCFKHNSSWNYLYYDYVGDFFMLTDDDDYILNQGTNDWRIRIGSNSFYDYPGNSLWRVFWTRKYIDNGYYWWDNHFSGYPVMGIMCGITLPINTALYYGASGTTDHAYEWQSETNGTWNNNYGDSTTALKRLTVSAMQKLKNEYGDNLRIYVIIYRPQAGDYSYLNNYAYNVLQANSANDLRTILEAIAVQIKNWAGYTNARLVN